MTDQDEIQRAGQILREIEATKLVSPSDFLWLLEHGFIYPVHDQYALTPKGTQARTDEVTRRIPNLQ